MPSSFQTLDQRYKTRIPWRHLLEIKPGQDIPHGKRDVHSSITSKRRQLKATRRAANIRSSIQKIQSNPWGKTDDRFFPNRIFLQKINNQEVVGLPIPSSLNTTSSMLRMSQVQERNYNDDITNPRYLKGRLSLRTGLALGPGAYLKNGPRSVHRNASLPSLVGFSPNGKHALRPSASFAGLKRPNVFQHMNTFENEVIELRKEIEEKKETRKRRLMQQQNATNGNSGEEGKGDHMDAEEPVVVKLKRKQPNQKRKVAPSTSMPLHRAYDWYSKYGNSLVLEKNRSRRKKKEKERKRHTKYQPEAKEEEEEAAEEEEEEERRGDNNNIRVLNRPTATESIEKRNRRIRFELQVIPASVAYIKETTRAKQNGTAKHRMSSLGGVPSSSSSSSVRLFSRDL
jgi:hypothetical protein